MNLYEDEACACSLQLHGLVGQDTVSADACMCLSFQPQPASLTAICLPWQSQNVGWHSDDEAGMEVLRK